MEERLAIERNLSEREADLAASQDNLREANHALSLLRQKSPSPIPFTLNSIPLNAEP